MAKFLDEGDCFLPQTNVIDANKNLNRGHLKTLVSNDLRADIRDVTALIDDNTDQRVPYTFFLFENV